MRLGIVQMQVGMDKDENVLAAQKHIADLAALGAEMVILPEMFCCPYSNRFFREYAECEGGGVWKSMSDTAREYGVYVVAGSMPELDGVKLYNTSFVFAPNGTQIARHRKMHLFDIDVAGGQRFFESETLTAGDEMTVFDTDFGRIGLCICFDMRFPELARLMALDGAQMILMPAAFNMTTGPLHWELMLRQRAVDNQVFTVGAAPARNVNAEYISYGNSMAVSPWGDIIYRADAESVSQVVELDLSQIERVRAQLPLLSARRTDLYDIIWRVDGKT